MGVSKLSRHIHTQELQYVSTAASKSRRLRAGPNQPKEVRPASAAAAAAVAGPQLDLPRFVAGIPRFVAGIPRFVAGIPRFVAGIPRFVAKLSHPGSIGLLPLSSLVRRRSPASVTSPLISTT